MANRTGHRAAALSAGIGLGRRFALRGALGARLQPTRGLQRLARNLVSDVDAELLGVARDSPALHIQRIA